MVRGERAESSPAIAGYEILERLGQGGMAEVWLAQRQGDERLLVIKRLLPQHARNEVTRKRILREAEVGALLDHPNIARTVDAGLTDGTVYVVTEYLAGKDLETLSHTLARGRRVLPAGVVARIMLEVLSGLHAAHEARGPGGEPLQLVHRDLSPRNIQLGFEGRVQLIDFGLAHARVGSLHTEPGTVLGTYRYMSPEQAIGEPVDRRSDLFSLGTSMYELFTGRWLFDAPSKQAILKMLVETRLEPPSSIQPALPRALDEVVRRAMAHHPADRFATAVEMRAALERAVPAWVRTPLAEIASLLELTFPYDAQRAREHVTLARHRSPKPEPSHVEDTREQGAATDVDPPNPEAAHRRSLMYTHETQEAAIQVTEVVRDAESRAVTELVRPRSRRARSSGRRPLSQSVDPGDQAALGGRYDLVRLLGRGGMGRVYLAQRRGAEELCVLKMMHADLVERAGVQQLRRFEREAEILSRLDHPNIPALRALEIRGRSIPFMEMEHVAGANLADLAARNGGAIPPDILIPLALQYLDALHHAHELSEADGRPMGLVHRDISPSNLMVTYEGIAKLIDFGVAHRADQQLTAVERPLIGKVLYCSPEQALQQPLDRRSDLYSFSVSLYELLTGRAMVDPTLEVGQARYAVVHNVPASLRTLDPAWPEALEHVLGRALEKPAHARYPDALALSEALDAATRPFPRAPSDRIAEFVRRSVPDRYTDWVQLREWALAEEPLEAPSRLEHRPSSHPGETPRKIRIIGGAVFSGARSGLSWPLVVGLLLVAMMGSSLLSLVLYRAFLHGDEAPVSPVPGNAQPEGATVGRRSTAVRALPGETALAAEPASTPDTDRAQMTRDRSPSPRVIPLGRPSPSPPDVGRRSVERSRSTADGSPRLTAPTGNAERPPGRDWAPEEMDKRPDRATEATVGIEGETRELARSMAEACLGKPRHEVLRTLETRATRHSANALLRSCVHQLRLRMGSGPDDWEDVCLRCARLLDGSP